jgi:tRNA (mo5U34)-methyltransferase
MSMRRSITPQAASTFIHESRFYWHQRFELATGVYTPGANDIPFLLQAARLPEDLRGATVLDIGATNGGLAFELERLGAARIVTIDIYRADWFGFDQLKTLLNSRVEYLRASVYELPAKLTEQFDIVAFCGVLYHLRHPLLALDIVRTFTSGRALIETAVCDRFVSGAGSVPLVLYHRLDDLNGDGSNWFEPSVAALTDWCRSCGLVPTSVKTWPAEAPGRCMVTARPAAGEPEYLGMSYELPLSAAIAPGYHLPGGDPAQRTTSYPTITPSERAVASQPGRTNPRQSQ